MTYCVGMCVDEGLVFLSDTRTNAGVDHVSAARKMVVFEQPGERVIVLLAAGNLALTQAVTHLLAEPSDPAAPTLYSVPTMAEAARIVGEAELRQFPGKWIVLAEPSAEFRLALHQQRRSDVEDAGARHAAQPLQRGGYDEIRAVLA